MGAAELLLRVVLAALWLQSVTALPVNGVSRRARLNGGALAPLQRQSAAEDLHAALEGIDAIHNALFNNLLSQPSRPPGTGEHGMGHGSGMGQDAEGHGSGMAATDGPSTGTAQSNIALLVNWPTGSPSTMPDLLGNGPSGSPSTGTAQSNVALLVDWPTGSPSTMPDLLGNGPSASPSTGTAQSNVALLVDWPTGSPSTMPDLLGNGPSASPSTGTAQSNVALLVDWPTGSPSTMPDLLGNGPSASPSTGTAQSNVALLVDWPTGSPSTMPDLLGNGPLASPSTMTESLVPGRALNPTEMQSTASEPHTTAVLPQSTAGGTKHSRSALMSVHYGHAHDHLQLASLNSLFCDFEMDLCAWTPSGMGHSDWLLHRERPDAFEGAAVTGEDGCRNKAGQYLYMESLYQHSQGYTAELRSWELTGAACLSFWYSVFGAGVDSLSVYLVYSESSLDRRLVWSDGGKETRQWYLETLDLAVTGAQKYRVVFIGTIGNGCNDAVLDDLEVWGQPCASVSRSTSKTAIMTANGGNFSTTTASSSTNGGNLPATENGTASVTANLATLLPTTARLGNATSAPPGSVLLYCSFESSLCGWTQFQGDDFDWRLHRERELTAGVRESGAGCRNLGGWYLYIEVISHRKTGDRAVLVSPPLSGSVCLSFWYSLLGQGVDSLSVYVLFSDTPELQYRLWERQGSSARLWARAEVPLIVELDRSFQLVLEGLLGEQPCGDAALDELMVVRGHCGGA